jgi:GntR family transcriptional repressor for pyruvate dehydrogenase complex
MGRRANVVSVTRPVLGDRARSSRPDEASAPFVPVESLRLSDGVVRQIADLIEQQVLKPGEKLPGERGLTHRLGVSRTAVREALRVLEGLGMVEVRPGKGSFIADPAAPRRGASRWREWLSQHRHEVLDLLEVRLGLEPQAAAMAADRASKQEVDAIHETVAAMKDAIDRRDTQAIVASDVEFHDRISRATRNQLLIGLNERINYLLLESRHAVFEKPGRAISSYRAHRVVAHAIARKDRTRAAAAMRRHVQQAKRLMTRLL